MIVAKNLEMHIYIYIYKYISLYIYIYIHPALTGQLVRRYKNSVRPGINSHSNVR